MSDPRKSLGQIVIWPVRSDDAPRWGDVLKRAAISRHPLDEPLPEDVQVRVFAGDPARIERRGPRFAWLSRLLSWPKLKTFSRIDQFDLLIRDDITSPAGKNIFGVALIVPVRPKPADFEQLAEIARHPIFGASSGLSQLVLAADGVLGRANTDKAAPIDALHAWDMLRAGGGMSSGGEDPWPDFDHIDAQWGQRLSGLMNHAKATECGVSYVHIDTMPAFDAPGAMFNLAALWHALTTPARTTRIRGILGL